MFKRTGSLLLVFILVVLVASTGCVTKKVFRKNVEDTESRITGVESAVEANERRIEDLGQETDDRIAAIKGTAEQAVEIGNTAVMKADAAQKAADKAALGKLLWTVTLSDDSVRFSFDQASIPDEAAAVLDDLINKIKSLDKAVYVEIEGHTDNIGSEDYNLQLGEMRAMAVRNYLNEKGGIPLHAISTISYGESRSVADNGTPEGRSANRRVVIRVLE
jgi:outer membrane protein OmpA-like peptidoglycan-associated protein